MATKILMEALSPTMEEGRLIEWRKHEGDPVAIGDVLAEVETDKAIIELTARAAGTLLKQIVPAGATVPVSTLLGVIGEPAEDLAKIVGTNAGGPKVKRADGPREPGAAAAVGVTAPGPAKAASPGPSATRMKASPLARRIAAERGVDLAVIRGSGPEGRVIMRDLESGVIPGRPAPPPSVALATLAAEEAAFTDVPLTQLRKTIAKRLAQSLGPIPTFYLTTEVDMERMAEAREALNEDGRKVKQAEEPKVSFNDIILKATALALRRHPACNAWWQEDRIRHWHAVHLGVAVAVEDGLITPVIRNADRKSLREIAAEAQDLVARARERRLRPTEYTDGTFTVSNLGMFDIDQFTAVINPPEAGVLAVGTIAPKPVVVNGAVTVRRRMRLTLSCDHRVIDGASGAAFLHTLKAMLENPLALVW